MLGNGSWHRTMTYIGMRTTVMSHGNYCHVSIMSGKYTFVCFFFCQVKSVRLINSRIQNTCHAGCVTSQTILHESIDCNRLLMQYTRGGIHLA